jgi:hypothetical protein
MIYLNTGRWQQAAEAARRQAELRPDADLIAAFALFECGRLDEAASAFLHGALNHPRAMRLLLGRRSAAPSSCEEAEDHNAGVALCRGLHTYLARQSRSAKRWFRALAEDPHLVKLCAEMDEAVRGWEKQHLTGRREPFDRMTLMRSRDFAKAEARKLRGSFTTPAAQEAAVN